MALDPEKIRSDFPALQRRVNGMPPAFFDGPGGTQVPQAVIDAVSDYLTCRNANTGGAFLTSVETDAAIVGARERLADFLGAPSPREIVFGANMTSLTFSLSRALGAEWEPGDELIVTELDHQANIAPWRRIAAERGLTVHSVPFDPETLQLDYERLESFLGPRTRLVAVGHASNAVGTVNDVQRVSRLARQAGALSFVDAVHSAPHRPIDVVQIGCDFLVCSVYKFFGPHLGVLWGKREHLERFSPVKVPPAVDTAPERWETGTLNHEGIAGAAAAIDWVAAVAQGTDTANRRHAVSHAMQQLGEYEHALFAQLLDGLSSIPGLRIYGPPQGTPRTPTAAFTLAGLSPEEVAMHLARDGIFVWNGDFYASSVVEGLGLAAQGGVVRAGVAPYTSGEDVDRLVVALHELSGRGR